MRSRSDSLVNGWLLSLLLSGADTATLSFVVSSPPVTPWIGFSLSDGTEAIIDDSDRHLIALGWRNCRGTPTRTQDGMQVILSRVLLGLAHGDPRIADHINGNTLDNRRANLRIGTPADNAHNARKRTVRSSRFKGVSRVGEHWQAHIRIDGRSCRIGTFVSEEAAARAYDRAASGAWQEWAGLNFPPTSPVS